MISLSLVNSESTQTPEGNRLEARAIAEFASTPIAVLLAVRYLTRKPCYATIDYSSFSKRLPASV